MPIIATFQPSIPLLNTDFAAPYWQAAVVHLIDQDWSGAPAPDELQTTARVLWTPQELLFGYECRYTELDVDEEFDVNAERHALWDRDVCEAFVRSPLEPDYRIYKEFEVAPTGQWVDLLINRIDVTHDWQWQSGMKTAAQIDEQTWRVAMAIPFAAFGLVPQSGDEWAANMFRVSRLNGERKFLAFAPTMTETPSYHVPERFVPLRFEGAR
ncbi:MAG TPA: carbohydrate-binding family 9-like protein [Blastocatellia bacterium]|nr:carbohydrate-binding family 9-like protein [Blastocatellia bacterium]